MARLLIPALLLTLALASCGEKAADQDAGTSADQQWGPLAVIEGSPNSEEAGLGGILSIDKECVTLSPPEAGGTTTLAWPSEATTWNPDTLTISYGDNEIIELSDGDELSFGGGSSDADAEWVAKPDPSCPGEGTFFVGAVSAGNETGP